MKYELTGCKCGYTVGELCSAFFPKIDGMVRVRLTQSGRITARCDIETDGQTASGSAWSSTPDNEFLERVRRQTVARAFYSATVKILGHGSPWGTMCGVRPAKMARDVLESGGDEADAVKYMERAYLVSAEKARLCAGTARIAADFNKTLEPRDFSLYIGIPFCPTRCSYCSFVSSAGGAYERFGKEYMKALARELDAIAQAKREMGLRCRTVYIGGGTPAILEPERILELGEAIAPAADGAGEFTMEMGRPDCITSEKLSAARKIGAKRVCVNPQTLCDGTLSRIGRKHTASDFYKTYSMTREAGFSINCDLIAGLPGEGTAEFEKSVCGLAELEPESITVHTLALKRAGNLAQSGAKLTDTSVLDDMLNFSRKALAYSGYRPYYLYRQKYSGNAYENIGWSKPGEECLYNVQMMEELGLVVACGAGAVTKYTCGGISRLHNPKYPEEYIARQDDICSKKRALSEFIRKGQHNDS